jgi:hypothetical protein
VPGRYGDDRELFITRFALQPRWKNGGNTPTRRMTIQVDWRGPPGPVPPPEYEYRNGPEPFFLAPKAIEPSTFIEIPTARALVDYGMDPIGLPPIILIWGRADYEDIFKRKHFTEWCHQLRLERHDGKKLRGGSSQWRDYNRSEESIDED